MQHSHAFGRRKSRILIVDDDVALNHHMAAFLRRTGFDVEQAFDPDSALQFILQDDPDLVIMDSCLPGGDGRAVLEQAAASGATPPALVVSGLDEQLAPQGRESARVIRWLNKPLPLPLLGDFLEQFFLHQRHAH
jgi:DNA-binding response OmpR family regulator